MQHFRRTLLTVLPLFAVVAALVLHPVAATASGSRVGREQMAPAATPPSRDLHDPNTGEPDSGLRSIPVEPSGNRLYWSIQAQKLQFLRTFRWTTYVWVSRFFGVGE